MKRALIRVVAVTLAAALCSSQGSASVRPNILVLMAEDMSARVGAFGDAVARTPRLDQLAVEGVRYPNTFTTAGVCAPSRAAHITGMHQIAIGAQHMRTGSYPGGSYRAVPPPGVKAYPELLRREGYFTWTDTKLDYQFSGSMFGSGPFTVWSEELWNAEFGWRQRKPGQPFYGLVNFSITHESGMFAPLGQWPNSALHFLLQVARAVTRPDAPDVSPTPPEAISMPPYLPDTPVVRQDIARHYDNIAIMDWQVGQILDALAADGLADSTIVVWTTDHGDGLPRSKRELYDTGIRVPMIIRWPTQYRPAGVVPGALDLRMISFVDLAPTLLRLAGAQVPDYLHGRDFLHGEPRQYVFAARDRVDEVPDRQRAARDSHYKYIRSWYPQQPGGHPLRFRDNMATVRQLHAMYARGELTQAQRVWFEPPGEERLYRLDLDPWELTDLSADPGYRQVLARMRGALDDWLARVGDRGEEPEAEMVRRFQPDGEQQVTAAPAISFVDGALSLVSATDGASLAYRFGDAEWQLYVGPVPVNSGAVVTVKAVRYGFQESDEVSATAP